MKIINKFFLGISLLIFLIFFQFLLFQLRIVILPATILIIGVGIRLVFKSQTVAVFSFLFPLVPAFAFFENHGFPFNYLVLPLILLAGILIGDIVLDRQKILRMLSYLNQYYLLLLFLILISTLFVILRWSNLTLPSVVNFANTPVAPPDLRFSFGAIFPLIYLMVFFLSPFYFLYLNEIDNKKKIVVAFLLGHSVSILFSLIQQLFNVRLFLWKPSNGFSSDTTTFGFLSSVSLLLGTYVFFKYGDKKKGMFFCLMALLGIFNSHSRLGLISVVFVGIYFLVKLKKRDLLVYILIVLVIASVSIYFIQHPTLWEDIILLKEMKRNLAHLQRYVILGQKDSETARKFLAGRERVWIYSLEIVKKFPLSGVGMGNFLFWVMFDQYGLEYFHDLAQNQYLSFSSGLGIPGLLLFLLFIFGVWRGKSGLNRWMFLCVLALLLFGSHFWMAESFLLFWLLVSLEYKKIQGLIPGRRHLLPILGILAGIFIMANIFHFDALHPKNWAKRTGTAYDYGFWYPEKDPLGKRFSWTKQKAGIYLYLDDKGKSRKIRLSCGAPIRKLKDRQQTVEIFWRGELYKRFIFTENRNVEFLIDDQSHNEGFLELGIDPAFNLKKMGISGETRNLGIQFFYPE